MSGRMSNIYTDKELLAVLNKDITNLTDEQKEIANYVLSDEGTARVMNLRLQNNNDRNALIEIFEQISNIGKFAYTENGTLKEEYKDKIVDLFMEMYSLIEPIKEKYNDFYNVPSTQPLLFIKQIFATNLFKNGEKYFEKTDRHTHYSIEDTPTNVTFKKDNRTSEIMVTLDDVKLFEGKNNKGLIKLFPFVMIKCNEQNYNKRIGFSLQELVDNGMYSSITTARKAVKDNLEKLRKLSISGYTKRGLKGKKIESEVHSSLITEWRIDNSYVTIITGEFINIEFLANYFTVLPPYAFKLSLNAFLLLDYIFCMARQHARSISENGTFKISLRAIRNYLYLPTVETVKEEKNRKYNQFIKEPIESAIEEIENENKSIDFTITPTFKSDIDPVNINEWLDGYLEIGLNGDFAERFISIAQKQEAEIKTCKKRKEKALLTAETKMLQESMKKK